MKAINTIGKFDEKKWAAQRDLETLIEASKIKKDPARMKACKSCAKERKAELANQIGEVSKIQDGDGDYDQGKDTDKDGD